MIKLINILRTLSLVLLHLVGLSSCMEHDPLSHVLPDQPMTMEVKIGENETRALQSGYFASGSEIGLFVVEQSGDSYNNQDYNNYKYRASGTGGTQEWNTTEDIYLSTTVGKVVAYYPYSSSVTDYTRIPVNTATQTDYMYATADGISNTDPHINLSMKHALSCFRLKVKKGSYGGAGVVSKVGVKSGSLASSAMLNAETGALSSFSGTGSFIYYPGGSKTITSGTFQDFDIMAIPATAANEISFAITMDGNEYTVSVPAISGGIKQGTIYSYTITADGAELVASDVSVSSWTEMQTVSGNTIDVGYKLTLAGDISGIAFAYSLRDGIVTIHAVADDAVSIVNQVTLTPSAGATFSASANDVVKILTLTDVKQDITLTFSGTTQTVFTVKAGNINGYAVNFSEIRVRAGANVKVDITHESYLKTTSTVTFTGNASLSSNTSTDRNFSLALNNIQSDIVLSVSGVGAAVQVGDFVYSDGSYSHYFNMYKTPVGICFYVKGTDRRMVALEKASETTSLWGANISTLTRYPTVDGTNSAGYLKMPDGTYAGTPHLSSSPWTDGVLFDMDGRGNTDIILAARGNFDYSSYAINPTNPGHFPPASYCDKYETEGFPRGRWYLPSMGELGHIYENLELINNNIDYCRVYHMKPEGSGGYWLFNAEKITEDILHSSNQTDSSWSGRLDLTKGYIYGITSNYQGYTRAVAKF